MAEQPITLDIQLSPTQIAQVQGMLKGLDPKIRRSLSRSLNKELKPVAAKIVSDFPGPPMSGLAPRWGGITAAVRVDVNGPPQKAIARFIVKANPPSFGKLLSITERAGSRSGGLTPQGSNLISNPKGGLQQRNPLVKGRGGRFIFRSFFEQRPDINRRVMASINKFIDDFNKGS